MAPKQIDQELQDKIVSWYQEGKTLIEIESLSGCSQGAVRRSVARANALVERRTLHTLDATYFQDIDTPDKAYWLGFLTANSCIRTSTSDTPCSLGVSIKIEDRAHLETLAAALRTSAEIKDQKRDKGTTSVLQICSTAMMADLARHGLSNNKCQTHRPWHGAAHLLSAYWKGVIDGKGTITERGYVYLSGMASLVAAFCSWAALITGKTRSPKPYKGIQTVACTTTTEAKALLTTFAAAGGPWLQRKKEIVEKFLAEGFTPPAKTPAIAE